MEKYYIGDITPELNVVFVYGANPQCRHGAGAAVIAARDFGALYGSAGKANELQGMSYGIVTQDLREFNDVPRGMPTVSRIDICRNIAKMYKCAKAHPHLQFKVAYRHLEVKSLANYTGYQFIDMFNGAMNLTPLPDNVIFSEEWYKTGKLNLNYGDQDPRDQGNP